MVDDHVNLAIVEKIAESSAASCHQRRQSGPFYGRNECELPIVQVVEQQGAFRKCSSPVTLIDSRIDVSVSRVQILPPVVVEVEKTGTPPEKLATEQARKFVADPQQLQ